MVVESYGYHHNKLETHVTAVSFDWNTFDPFLTVPLLRGVSVADFFYHNEYNEEKKGRHFITTKDSGSNSNSNNATAECMYVYYY
mmetsp:Transcript_34541/g.35125  ORF Transcript_34541/g.35125 Transcript_34541/m.35125 type:complete len:85 (+) Transcript_34541:812-1066(+)